MKNQIMNTLLQKTQSVRCSLLLVAALLFVANPAAAQTAAAPGNMGPTLNKIASAGVLYAAHREAAVPFSYVGSGAVDAQVYGYSWELCQHVAEGRE